ncbi:MAG: InlB B-repeat-containing protein [Bacilli bacterium]|nr:InlB B-repeat-containing protein [Bacilli bacterium]
MRKCLIGSFCLILVLLLGVLLLSCKEEDNKEAPEISISLTQDSVELNVGDTYKINVEIKNTVGVCTYEVGDSSIVSIQDDTITALKSGNTQVAITVTCDDEDKTIKELVLNVKVIKEAKTEYTITYESSASGFVKESETIKAGETKTIGDAPQIEGYEFVGWIIKNSSDTGFITEISNVNSNITILAIYVVEEYMIKYSLRGGSYDGEATAKYGDIIELGEPSKEGYKFLGWTIESSSTDYITEVEVKGDITLYAHWKSKIVYPEGVFPISYDLDGGGWNIIYYTPLEIASEFLADFKASSGRAIEPKDFDCAYIESSWFGDMMQNNEYLNKWMWLLDGIWEAAQGSSAQKAATADFTDLNVKGFYITNLNGFFTSTLHKEGILGTLSANYEDSEISFKVYSKGPSKSEEIGPETYKKGEGVSVLPTPVKKEYVFIRWEDKDGNAVTSISTTQEGDIDLKAIWEHEIIAERVDFSNVPTDGLKLYSSLGLKWTVYPDNAVNKKVTFYSLTGSVLSVTEEGVIKAKSTGLGKIRVRLDGNSSYEYVIEINVWSGDYFDVSYETDSYVNIGSSIKLNAAYINNKQAKENVTWSSLNTDIASVDSNGNVTGVSSGLATIRATVTGNDSLYFDFVVTVLPSDISDVMQFIVNNHHSNAQTTYDVGIGDGNPEYYYDVVGGVNNLIFDDLKIDRRYYDKLPSGTKNHGEMTSVEFITIHYTGNMKYGADADNNCSYFNNLEYRASIHFVTGRTNLTDLTGQSSGYNADAYYAFAGLNEKYGGWHATNGDPAVWDDTGLTVLEGDPATPVISISKNMKYTINGRETNISIPTPPSGYTVDGDSLIVDGRMYTVFNQYGILAKVENGKYYIARTHWGTQRSPRCICTCGGNRNSIGIESCVDIGSDLEHTWHVTAQLVAKLLVDYNLGFDRVVGHHFFSGKNCPQPFLENDMKLWYEFMDMVKAEYELLTTYKDADISAKAVKSDGVLRDNGLLVQDGNAHCVTYEVTIKVGDKTETITLATIVESNLKGDCKRTEESLQMQDYGII